MPFLQFPGGFIFDTATAAYQIECRWLANGKGPSVRDTFMHRRKYLNHRRAAECAMNTYRDFVTDLDLMAAMELNAYRFFIVAHHQILGHGLAGDRIYSLLPDTEMELTLSQFPVYPL